MINNFIVVQILSLVLYNNFISSIDFLAWFGEVILLKVIFIGLIKITWLMIILSYLEELILAMFNILNLSGKELYFLNFLKQVLHEELETFDKIQ